MPKSGDTVEKDGKKYKWTGQEFSGYWSQVDMIKPVGHETFCEACNKVRGEKDNPTFLAGRHRVLYQFYNMCGECYDHVNSHREEFIKEFQRLKEIKAKANTEQEING
tara:strand:+ start:3473 stop:3796 length:324 start_codon:yes stop_codon:yes gene_type:complete